MIWVGRILLFIGIIPAMKFIRLFFNGFYYYKSMSDLFLIFVLTFALPIIGIYTIRRHNNRKINWLG